MSVDSMGNIEMMDDVSTRAMSEDLGVFQIANADRQDWWNYDYGAYDYAGWGLHGDWHSFWDSWGEPPTTSQAASSCTQPVLPPLRTTCNTEPCRFGSIFGDPGPAPAVPCPCETCACQAMHQCVIEQEEHLDACARHS